MSWRLEFLQLDLEGGVAVCINFTRTAVQTDASRRRPKFAAAREYKSRLSADASPANANCTSRGPVRWSKRLHGEMLRSAALQLSSPAIPALESAQARQSQE
jgi:hypothetical protein